MLAATNAANAAVTAIAGSAPRGSGSAGLQSVLTPLAPAGPRAGGGMLLSSCFGGKVLMWDFGSVVSALDQRQRIEFNAKAVAKAIERAEAIAEKNKQNQRGGGKR